MTIPSPSDWNSKSTIVPANLVEKGDTVNGRFAIKSVLSEMPLLFEV
jgi:hypothetical protein